MTLKAIDTQTGGTLEAPKKRYPIPSPYRALNTYVVVQGAARFLEFLKEVFGAEERGRFPNADGTIGHAEVMFGDTVLLMFDAKPDWPVTPAFLMVYVEDCDATHKKALAAGATEVTPLSENPRTNPWGDGGSRIRDPLGNIWWIQTHLEDPSEEEMLKRMQDGRYARMMEVSTETIDRAMKAIPGFRPGV